MHVPIRKSRCLSLCHACVPANHSACKELTEFSYLFGCSSVLGLFCLNLAHTQLLQWVQMEETQAWLHSLRQVLTTARISPIRTAVATHLWPRGLLTNRPLLPGHVAPARRENDQCALWPFWVPWLLSQLGARESVGRCSVLQRA